MKKIRVGSNHMDYGSMRNFVSLPFRHSVFKRTYDIFSAPKYLIYKFNRFFNLHPYLNLETSVFLESFHFDFGLNGVELLHFFNSVSLSRTPWVVTFETTVPRWNPASRLGLKLLAGSDCRKIIAISKNAYDVQSYLLEMFPEYRDRIKSKMCVVHPAQKSYLRHMNEKKISWDKEIIFTMVGAQFFIKGGKEILLSFDRLIEEGRPVRLNIVSNLEIRDFLSESDREDLRTAKRLIQKHPRQIRHYEALPNDQVMALFQTSHVGLLPTYSDTYGYSVLEAQACGCPVITTDIRVLPEINNDETGWVIEVPKDRLGVAEVNTAEKRKRCSEIIQEGLYRIASEICDAPEAILVKGEKSLERIQNQHDPEKTAETLENIYREALS